MLQEALDLFRRYVEAQERIATCLEAGTAVPMQTAEQRSEPEWTKREIAAPAQEEPPSKHVKAVESMTRDELKAELDTLGAQYNKKAATKTLLQKVLEMRDDPDPSQPAESPAEKEEEQIPEKDPEPAPQKARTVQEVREALITYAKSFEDFSEGKEKSRELLKKVGGVDRLGELTDDKYDDVIVAAQVDEDKE